MLCTVINKTRTGMCLYTCVRCALVVFRYKKVRRRRRTEKPERRFASAGVVIELCMQIWWQDGVMSQRKHSGRQKANTLDEGKSSGEDECEYLTGIVCCSVRRIARARQSEREREKQKTPRARTDLICLRTSNGTSKLLGRFYHLALSARAPQPS